MALFDRLNDFARNISDKTTDVIENGKLSFKVSSEKTAAEAELKNIGAYYYSVFAEGGEVAPDVLEFCEIAKSHYDAAAEAQAEIDRAKNEKAERAAATAASYQETEEAENTGFEGIACPNCGLIVQDGTKFCPECGAKIEVVVQEKKCPTCGAVVQPGMKFCSECGTKTE